MKRIYLVKKDPETGAGDGNWQIMTGEEFAEFIRTPEGMRRRKAFGQLDGCETDDTVIVAECGEETAREWRREKDRRDYLRERMLRSGHRTVSLEAEGGAYISAEDTEGGVEEAVMRRMAREALRRAVAMLADDEADLIRSLFLAGTPDSEKSYATRHRISQQAVHKRKLRILKKLNGMLGE